MTAPTLSISDLTGVIREFAEVIEPHTEAAVSALVFQLLAAVGNAVGRNAYITIDGNKHHMNLFLCLVGESSRGRKGTSWARVLNVVASSDSQWAEKCLANGLSSGEGLINCIRDPAENGAFEGINEKRILVIESEFAQVLKQFQRDGNILSATLRDAWDGKPLRIMTKSNPIGCKEPHISIVGHITKADLTQYMKSAEISNGFANRFLWVSVSRSKLLPFGGTIPEETLKPIVEKVRAAIAYGKITEEIKFAEEAKPFWEKIYIEFNETEYPGVLDHIISRGPPNILRLATIISVLDHSSVIAEPHLASALTLWKYAEASAKHIFGASLGDPLAEKLLEIIKRESKLSKTMLHTATGKNLPVSRIDEALEKLVSFKLIRRVQHPGDGIKSSTFLEYIGPNDEIHEMNEH